MNTEGLRVPLVFLEFFKGEAFLNLSRKVIPNKTTSE